MTTCTLVYWHTESDSAVESLASPFEEWCEARQIHPEAPRAWEQYALGL